MKNVIRKSDNFAEQFIVSVLAQFLERRQVSWAVSVASGSIYHRVNSLKIGRPDETTPRKLYQPEKSKPKWTRLFSFSRPWPWTYFVNGPNAAVSTAPTLFTAEKVVNESSHEQNTHCQTNDSAIAYNCKISRQKTALTHTLNTHKKQTGHSALHYWFITRWLIPRATSAAATLSGRETSKQT